MYIYYYLPQMLSSKNVYKLKWKGRNFDVYAVVLQGGNTDFFPKLFCITWSLWNTTSASSPHLLQHTHFTSFEAKVKKNSAQINFLSMLSSALNFQRTLGKHTHWRKHTETVITLTEGSLCWQSVFVSLSIRWLAFHN